MFRSLRVRIALSHALVLLVILVSLGVTLQYVLARTLDASVTRQPAVRFTSTYESSVTGSGKPKSLRSPATSMSAPSSNRPNSRNVDNV